MYIGDVTAYNDPYYTVLYEDGDSEELGATEVQALLLKVSARTVYRHPCIHFPFQYKKDVLYQKRTIKKMLVNVKESISAQLRQKVMLSSKPSTAWRRTGGATNLSPHCVTVNEGELNHYTFPI